MKKIFTSTLPLGAFLSVSAQDVVWQTDIKFSTQDFLSQIIPTIDRQYLVAGSSIQPSTGLRSAHAVKSNRGFFKRPASKQNQGYDFHLVKLNQQGDEVWEKYFSGQNHDFLSATVNTQEGGFLLGEPHSVKKD